MVNKTEVLEFYERHKEHVDDMILNEATCSFEPAYEDIKDPALWKPGHWKWFFENG